LISVQRLSTSITSSCILTFTMGSSFMTSHLFLLIYGFGFLCFDDNSMFQRIFNICSFRFYKKVCTRRARRVLHLLDVSWRTENIFILRKKWHYSSISEDSPESTTFWFSLGLILLLGLQLFIWTITLYMFHCEGKVSSSCVTSSIFSQCPLFLVQIAFPGMHRCSVRLAPHLFCILDC
jgi:hypothetical protein